MGLDVGVVQIDYSQVRPTGAAYRFAWISQASGTMRHGRSGQVKMSLPSTTTNT